MVSIRIQPGGQMQLAYGPLLMRAVREFQSASSPKARCNPMYLCQPCNITGFNPHPAQRPDATTARRTGIADKEFQSASSPKARCNLQHNQYCMLATVSIRIQPKAQLQRPA